MGTTNDNAIRVPAGWGVPALAAVLLLIQSPLHGQVSQVDEDLIELGAPLDAPQADAQAAIPAPMSLCVDPADEDCTLDASLDSAPRRDCPPRLRVGRPGPYFGSGGGTPPWITYPSSMTRSSSLPARRSGPEERKV